MTTLTTLAAALALACAAPEKIDLAERYPPTLERSRYGLAWVSDASDVYRLERFEFRQGRALRLACGQATLVVGRHGTNALWAAVLPDESLSVEAKQVPEGATARELFLRFAPSEIGELFPAATIAGPGDPVLRARAARLFHGKIGWKWATPSGNTTVVPEGVVVADFDGSDGVRRLFAVEGRKTVYVSDFEGRPLPPPVPLTSERARAIFLETWSAFEQEYAGFVRHPDLDWAAHGAPYEERAAGARDVVDLAGVLSTSLAVLEDLHVWVTFGGAFAPGYVRERHANGTWTATEAAIGKLEQLGPNIAYGRTSDGIGYLAILGLGDRQLAQQADAALEALADTWALVLDLRYNGGGDETLAREVAGRFLEREVPYAKSRFRGGPGLHDLGPAHERRVAPRGPWRYASPVWVLQGPLTLSSAESFVHMLAQAPNVTTAGANTGGSSGNPRRLEFPEGLAVNLPRWLDLDLADRPIEGVGIDPEARIEFPAGAYDEADPLIGEVLERLRRTPKRERAPGRR